MDFKQWIYSPDIARWLSEERNLGLMELTDCILSAPHRTMGEKDVPCAVDQRDLELLDNKRLAGEKREMENVLKRKGG